MQVWARFSGAPLAQFSGWLAQFQGWLVLALVAVLAGCSGNQTKPSLSSNTGKLIHGVQYEQVPLEPQEQLSIIKTISTQVGKPYVWGAQSPSRGFDCSGLLVWSYTQLGLRGFRYQSKLEGDVTADALYKYNTYPLTDMVQLREGDWIFFDPKSQGYETHVAVFSHIDGQGRVWVWDASSTAGRTSQRPVPNFWGKNPVFGRPMKLVPATMGGVAVGTHIGPVLVSN